MSACAVMLCACSSENGVDDVPVTPPTPPEPVEQLPIRISSMPEARALDNAFETDDRIGVFVVNRNADGSAVGLKAQGNYIDNSMYTFHGTWTSAVQEYWKDDITHADFYMYYPYTQTVASVSAMPFGVIADQSSLGAYKSSDLIVGSTLDVAPSASSVNIAARHLMSQVEIVLKAGAGYSESSLADADVSVKMNNLATSATVDLATSTVSANGSVRSLTPYKDGAVYRAFVVPQTATGNNLITITVDGADHNISKTVTFVGGKRHTLTATLSKEGGGLSVSISAWESDGIDYGGVAS